MDEEREVVEIEIDRLLDFVDGLQASGYGTDPRQIAALNHLLIVLIARGESLNDLPLKTIIAPLVCSSPLGQQDFYQRYDRWYATVFPAKQIDTQENLPLTPPSQEVTPKEKTPPATDSRAASTKKAYITRETTDRETIYTRVRVKGFIQEIFPVTQIKPIVSALRKRTQVPSTEVDVEKTLEHAIKYNNWLDSIYRQRQILPEYVVLIDRKNRLDQQARFVQEILAKLAADGVWLYQYEFKGDPRICFPLDQKNIPLRLRDLQARHPDSRLLVFSGINELTNPLSGKLQTWVESLEYWKERAIVTPDNLGKILLEELGTQNFAVLPLTFDGLASVVRVLESENVPLAFSHSSPPNPLNERPMRWTGRNAPPEAEISALINNLKTNYLDQKGFYWLCATAVYPEIRWELTLHLGSVLKDRTDKPLLDGNNLIQLTRLPWFRFGYMPDWFRLALIDSFSEEQEVLVRQALIDLLSLVYKGKEFDLIFSQRSNSHRKKDIQKLLRALKQTPSIEGPLQDQIFVKFILERQRKKLSVAAPEYIQNALKADSEDVTSKSKLGAESPIISPLPVQLVDRIEQLQRFTEVLDRISRQGPVTSNIFEWYGSPGIGKSTLVHMLVRRAAELRALYVIVDFKQSPNEEYLKNPIILIEKIVSDLKAQITIDTHDFDSAVKEYRLVTLPINGVVSSYSVMDQEERLYRRPDWLTKLRNVIIDFIKLINTLPSQPRTNGIRPIVLFFDEADHAYIDLIDWMEEWVINPLVQIKHCVVVWTARRPWRWKRPEIRRRLTSEMLGVYTPDLVKEQILSWSDRPDLEKELFKNISALTGGHPYANAIMINELDTLAKKGEKITIDTFSEYESHLLVKVFDRFIEDYAFAELDSPELKIACKYIALVRLFDSTMLREILQSCAGEPFTFWSQEDFGNLLLQLKNTQLLVWDKGYALDGGLRHIIQKYFMVLERSTFVKANQVALQVYRDWLARPVDNRGLFVVEELYHYAALSQVGERVDLRVVLQKRLEEYPTWIKDEYQLDNALDRLEGEILNDKELEQFTSSNYELAKQVQEFRKTWHSPLSKSGLKPSEKNSRIQMSRAEEERIIKTAKFALIIANASYEDSQFRQLFTPENDATGLAQVLRDPDFAGFDNVDILLNQESEAIRSAISHFYSNRKQDDLILLYYSGHGILNSKGKFFLGAKETKIKALEATGISSDFILRAMNKCQSKRQLVLLDCSHGGAFIGSNIRSSHQGMVLASSNATQTALVGDKIVGDTQYSLFTQFLIQGIKGEADLNRNGEIRVLDLFEYLTDQISVRTSDQTPYLWASDLQENILLCQNLPRIDR